MYINNIYSKYYPSLSAEVSWSQRNSPQKTLQNIRCSVSFFPTQRHSGVACTIFSAIFNLNCIIFSAHIVEPIIIVFIRRFYISFILIPAILTSLP
jgi:hypothetical protein